MTRFYGEPIIELSMTEEVAKGLVSLLNEHPDDKGFADVARSLQTVIDRNYDSSGVDGEFNVSTP
jgi:hypothetical protein